jgi:hypothetical protein
MSKKWTVTAFFVITMVILLASPLAAEDILQATDGQSNTAKATAGIFTEDRDNYLDTLGIGSLTKNLIFANFFNTTSLIGGVLYCLC